MNVLRRQHAERRRLHRNFARVDALFVLPADGQPVVAT